MPTTKIDPPLEVLSSLRQPLTEGERIALDFFSEHLPSDWEIYIQPHLNGLRPDFVLLSPRKGIAVYEVKDWDLSAMRYFYKNVPGRAPMLFGDDGRKQFSLEKINPVARINLYREEIFNLYCPRLAKKGGFGLITAGLIFPFADSSAALTLLEPARSFYNHVKYSKWNTVVGRDSIREKNIEKALPNAYRLDQRMSADLADDLRNWLVEPEFSKEQRIPLHRELDSKQREIVETRTPTGLRRIRGSAGSGKSIVLAGRAAKLAEEGKSVLLVTFNITLINYLLDYAVRLRQSGKVRQQISALNFHYWCKRIALQAGHITDYHTLWQSENRARILDTSLAKATEQWLADIDPKDKYQAILVDEGQDFRREWWSALRTALAEGGEMLLCADKTQNIYGMPQAWTDEPMHGSGMRGRWTELKNSYRLPPSLCALATRFIEEYLSDIENPRPVPAQGQIDYHTELRWIQARPEETIDACCDALLEITRRARPQVSFADLTLIVDNAEIGRAVVARLRQANIHCIDTFEDADEDEAESRHESRRKKLAFFKGDARLKVTTLHSFKGWESRALVVQFAHASSPEALALVYAGITRLKRNDQGSYLTVVCNAPNLESYGREWPDFRSALRST